MENDINTLESEKWALYNENQHLYNMLVWGDNLYLLQQIESYKYLLNLAQTELKLKDQEIKYILETTPFVHLEVSKKIKNVAIDTIKKMAKFTPSEMEEFKKREYYKVIGFLKQIKD